MWFWNITLKTELIFLCQNVTFFSTFHGGGESRGCKNARFKNLMAEILTAGLHPSLVALLQLGLLPVLCCDVPVVSVIWLHTSATPVCTSKMLLPTKTFRCLQWLSGWISSKMQDNIYAHISSCILSSPRWVLYVCFWNAVFMHRKGVQYRYPPIKSSTIPPSAQFSILDLSQSIVFYPRRTQVSIEKGNDPEN